MSDKYTFPANPKGDPQALLLYYFHNNDFVKVASMLASDLKLFKSLDSRLQPFIDIPYIREEVLRIFTRKSPLLVVTGLPTLEEYEVFVDHEFLFKK